MKKRLGLIAGVGRLPVAFAQAAHLEGYYVVGIAVVPEYDPELTAWVNEFHRVGVGQLEKIIHLLHQAGVEEVVMIGKVTKERLFDGTELDERVQEMLSRLPNQNDDTVLLGLIRELAREGIAVREQNILVKTLFPEEGVLTRRAPSAREWEDIRFGFPRAKAIGGWDIGQTVVVKNRAIMAVEAIEGTDATIRRGCSLARGGAVVVKVAKPQQDLRFDIPAVGPETIRTMSEVGGITLAIEAGKTFVVDREETVKLANKAGVAIVAVKEEHLR